MLSSLCSLSLSLLAAVSRSAKCQRYRSWKHKKDFQNNVILL